MISIIEKHTVLATFLAVEVIVSFLCEAGWALAFPLSVRLAGHWPWLVAAVLNAP